jgi:hypothetical protein
MSKESKTFVEDTFKAAKGKPDYPQLSKDLLDDFAIVRSVQQLKQWWRSAQHYARNRKPSLTADAPKVPAVAAVAAVAAVVPTGAPEVVP